MKADGFVRAREGAEFMGVGESTFWTWAKREGFPKPIRMSERLSLFDLSELRAWLLAQREAANDPGRVGRKAGRNA